MEKHSPVPHHSPGGHGCGVQGVVKEPRRWDYDCRDQEKEREPRILDWSVCYHRCNYHLHCHTWHPNINMIGCTAGPRNGQ